MTALPPDVVADLRQENARLQAELRTARERQTASAEILRAVASAGGDAGRSLQRIAEITASLFGASSVSLLIADGERWGQTFRVGAGSERIASAIPLAHVAITTQFMPGAVYLENRQVHVPDTDDPAALARWPGATPARAAGTRTMSGTPLRREGGAIGALIVHRDRLEPFTEDELALQQSFADQAVIAIENARLFNETKEALERQTATADILKVIASSPSDVQPVFEAIAASSNRLIDGLSTAVHRVIDDALHLAAFTRTTPAGDAALQASFPRPLSSAAWGENIRNGETVHIPDVEIEWAGQPTLLEMARLRRFRSLLFVPLLRHGTTIGIISVSRKEAGTFAPHYVLLLQTFADQAVIAIENVRLFNETKEALERQTATADILKVIASSPSDIQPVFEAIATSANRLVGGFSSTVFRLIDGIAHLKAFTPTTPAADQVLQSTFPRPAADFPPFRMAQAGEVTRIPDTEALSDEIGDIARARGFRSMLFAPLMNDGVSIGLIAVTRVQPSNFTDHHVQLLQTFADQAVIAIENVRLFEEVQAKTRDLSEALQQQTATADALKVISRSAFDLQTVLETLTHSAVELSGADRGIMLLRDGDLFRFRAHSHPDANPDWIAYLRAHPQKAGRNSASARSILSGQIISVPDVLADPEIDMPATALAGIRAVLAVPLLRDGKVEGVMVLSRPTAGPFNARQIDLVQTFADQAVIAIENVRLFDEVQAKTRELSETLTYQTGSSNILSVIASSPTDVGPVLKAIVESACALCDADDAVVSLREGDDLRFAAHHGPIPVGFERRPISRGFVTGRAVVDKVPIHVKDVFSAEGDEYPEAREMSRRAGIRTLLSVPLLRENESIGAIMLRRTGVNPFSDKQISLLQTFADQAVIAIGNVRLFDEVQARTKELAASLDELRTAQDRLVQTEKLASLGQLTAGIAHEIKNPLNFVNNFAALSAELTDELNEVLKPATLAGPIREEVEELTGLLKDNLQKVVQHGKRADSIVKNMLLHSREGSGEHRPADINALLDESLNLAYHGARAEKPQFNVTLQRDFDDTAGMVELFPQEITRVLLNLISNGFYAVSKRKTDDGETDFEPHLRAATRNLGDTVEIRIRDNGTGIPAEVKEKMFNPFFTTKPAGEGTGLGLSMSHDIIVKQHGGRIEVETEPGQFTEFRIVLPRTSGISNKDRGQT